MRLLFNGSRYESEVIPRARFSFVRTISSSDDQHLTTSTIVRTPFKKWQKYIHPWHFGHTEGWCTLTVYIKYNVRSKRLEFGNLWEPLES